MVVRSTEFLVLQSDLHQKSEEDPSPRLRNLPKAEAINGEDRIRLRIPGEAG